MDFLCAILIGYFEGYFKNGMWLRLSKETLRSIEGGLCCSFVSQRPDFIRVDACDQSLLAADNLVKPHDRENILSK